MKELQSFLSGKFGFASDRVMLERAPDTGRIEWMPALDLVEKVDMRIGYRVSAVGRRAGEDEDN
jgi:hypothetical protein